MTTPAPALLCNLYTMILAGSPIHYTINPRGLCFDCCKIQEREDIKFFLYTTSLNKYYRLHVNDKVGLRRSNFNFNLPTVIYMHGFTESAHDKDGSSQSVKNAFVRTRRYNVILVDWSVLVAAPWINYAVENIPRAGRYVARFIRFLLEQGYQVKNFHLIGFSLGAELAGFVGNQLLEWRILLPRITGLDPPLPFFGPGSSNRRLYTYSAQFVDVIHTDAGLLGTYEALGHADFFPNGGNALQPGCIRQEILNFNFVGIVLGCSHRRAWQYFIESVERPYAFPAYCEYPCYGVMPFMGLAADRRLRGSFYLETNSASPFGRGVRAVGTNSAITNDDEADTALSGDTTYDDDADPALSGDITYDDDADPTLSGGETDQDDGYSTLSDDITDDDDADSTLSDDITDDDDADSTLSGRITYDVNADDNDAVDVVDKN